MNALVVEHQGKTVDLKPIEFVNAYRVDQVQDAIRHIRHAKTLGLPELRVYAETDGKCVIVGGAPSAVQFLPQIKELAADPKNAVFALNYTHNWLIDQGIIPKGCLMFEIDVDPTKVLEKPHPQVNYFVCSLCHPTTFEGLKDCNVTVWHCTGSGEGEKTLVVQELFGPDALLIGGGSTTFLRTIALSMALGFRKWELFGVDSSFPEESETTHFQGYPSDTTPADAIWAWANCSRNGKMEKFKSVGYLVQQAEHFREFIDVNREIIKFMYVHGEGSMLRFIHENEFPEFYS